MDINFATLNAEFGAYYLNNGQNASRLFRLIYRRGVTEQLFGSVSTRDTIWRAAKTTFSRLLQAFQVKWTPKGELTLLPVEIRQFRLKADVEIQPDQLYETWAGFLTDNNLSRKDWPLIRWLIEWHLVPQMEEEFELDEIYWAVRAEPTPGTPSAPRTTIDGIRKQINGHISSGRTVPIALGTVPTDPVLYCEYVEAFCDAIALRYRSTPMQLAMDENSALKYARGRAKKYDLSTTVLENARKAPDGNNPVATAIPVEFHPSKSVIGLPSMNGSAKIWTSPADNCKRLITPGDNMGKFALENVDRTVKLYTDFSKGIGFVMPELIFTNDKDLV